MRRDGREAARGAATVVVVVAAVTLMALVWVGQRPDAPSASEPRTGPAESADAGTSTAGRGAGVPELLTLTTQRPRVTVHAPSRPQARGLLAQADQAVRTVRQVLPRWRGELVIRLPDSQRSLEQELAVPAGTYDGIAAVTAAGSDGLVVHLNPAVYDELAPIGRRVVLAHEAAHVAAGIDSAPDDESTGETTADETTGDETMPAWLREGFADYVALRDVQVPVPESARHQLARVRDSGAPAALPGQARFESSGDELAAAYEGSWLACRLVAGTDGERALVALYRAVAGGQPLEVALGRHTSYDLARLTTTWQAELRALATR